MDAEQMRRESGDNPLRALLVEQNPDQLELPLPPVPHVWGNRKAVVVCCQYCRLPHFSMESWRTCLSNHADEGQEF